MVFMFFGCKKLRHIQSSRTCKAESADTQVKGKLGNRKKLKEIFVMPNQDYFFRFVFVNWFLFMASLRLKRTAHSDSMRDQSKQLEVSLDIPSLQVNLFLFFN